RLVPLHPAATRRLRHYAKRRSREFPQAKHFFVSHRGLALPYCTVCDVFRGIARDVPSSNDRPHVRLHDLRHTFACRVLLKWQRSTCSSCCFTTPALEFQRFSACACVMSWPQAPGTWLFTAKGARSERFHFGAARKPGCVS